MTSSNGNIFRVTGHLCGEFTGPRWIPHTQRPVARSFDVFFDLRLNNDWVNNREAGELRRYRTHYDVIVMPVKIIGAPRNIQSNLTAPVSFLGSHRFTVLLGVAGIIPVVIGILSKSGNQGKDGPEESQGVCVLHSQHDNTWDFAAQITLDTPLKVKYPGHFDSSGCLFWMTVRHLISKSTQNQ